MITIGICSYRRSQFLLKTLSDLEAQDFKGFEVVIVEQLDAEEEGIALDASQYSFALVHHVVRDWANLPKARNTIVGISSGDIVVFIDDDVRLKSSFVASYQKAFEENPSASAVLGRVLAPKTGESDSNGTSVPGDPCGGKVFQNKVDFGRGCNMGYRNSVFCELQLRFDESFIGNALREETDFLLRLRRAGGICCFSPECELVHLGEPSGGCRSENETKAELSAQYLENRAYNNLYYYRKNFGTWVGIGKYLSPFSGHLIEALKNQSLISLLKVQASAWNRVRGVKD